MTDSRNNPIAVGQRVRVRRGAEGFVREICDADAKSRRHIYVTSLKWPDGGWGGWYFPAELEIVPVTAADLDVNYPTENPTHDPSVPGRGTA